MTVLVGYASARSSTQGIAEEIGDRLLKAGVRAVVRPMADVHHLEFYDSVVLGSAIHNGAWLPEASAFLARHANELSSLPLWLFSVSSVGDTSSFFGPRVTRFIRRTRKDARPIADARNWPKFRGHRDFAGVIARGQWGRVGDLFLKVCGGVPGDYRDWQAVDEWARSIAGQVLAVDWAKERTRLRLVPPLERAGRAR